MSLMVALVVVVVGQTIAIVMLATRTDESSDLVGRRTLDAVAEWESSRGAIGELRAIKEMACKCQDAECANEVQEEFNKFLEKHKDTKGNQGDAEAVGKLASEMSECLMKAATGGE